VYSPAPDGVAVRSMEAWMRASLVARLLSRNVPCSGFDGILLLKHRLNSCHVLFYFVLEAVE
jgi:hypothetical protein